MHLFRSQHFSRKGQSFLALVFLIGGIVAVIGVTLAFLTNSFIDSGFGYQAAAIAQSAAISGAEDALLKLDRNPSFSGIYSLPVGSNTTNVTVTQNSPTTNLISIKSNAVVSGRTGAIDVIVGENASTSQMTIVSWQAIQ